MPAWAEFDQYLNGGVVATYTTSGSIAGIQQTTIRINGTTSRGYYTYMVAPGCKSRGYSTTRLVLKKTYRDDANNVLYSLENPSENGIWIDDNTAFAFKGDVTYGGFRCLLGLSDPGGVPGTVNSIAIYTMKPIDASLGVPDSWSSQLPYWITTNQDDILPSAINPWDKALLARAPTGVVTLQYNDITYCYLTANENTLRHEFSTSQTTSESLNKITVSATCNRPAKMKVKLIDTGYGPNSNDIKLYDGLTSRLYFNDTAIPVAGLTINTLKGVSVVGILRSHITNSATTLKPGVYSGSTAIVYSID